MPPKQRASLHGPQLSGLHRGESNHTTTGLSPFPRTPLDRAGERQKIDRYWKSSNEKYCVSQVIITCDSLRAACIARPLITGIPCASIRVRQTHIQSPGLNYLKARDKF